MNEQMNVMSLKHLNEQQKPAEGFFIQSDSP